MNYRRAGFWIFDRFRGGQIGKAYHDAKLHYSSKYSQKKSGIEDNRLSNILKHARETTEFYKRYDSNSLHSFPVINKNTIRENEYKFISNRFSKDELVSRTTSGSTGTPFTVYHSVEKIKRNTADTILYGELGGYFIGNKLAYLKIWSSLNHKSGFTRWLENMVCVDVLNLSRDAENVIEHLNGLKGPLGFMGYSSAFETLVNKLNKSDQSQLKVCATGVICISESLSEEVKKSIAEIFKCKVVSRYSNIENGIIAQQIDTSTSYFRINTSSYLVEIFDLEKDELLPYGFLGRIVITDYHNKGMPMIRYDTGDLGCIELVEIDGVPTEVISKIEGRKLDQIFNTQGELISSYIVYRNMFEYKEIDQYQLIQKKASSYVMKITAKNGFNRENRLVEEFKFLLGEEADFRIEYVDEIPLLNSGKRKKVVNEMVQQ